MEPTEPRPCGLPNLGATCGINSLLQAIYHTGVLRNTLVAAGAGPGATMTGRLQGLFRTMMDGGLEWKPAVQLMEGLVGELYGRAGMQPGEEQDVTELWTYLADRLGEEMFDEKQHRVYKPRHSSTAGLCQRATQDARAFNKTSASRWLNLLQGFYIQQVHCVPGRDGGLAAGCGYTTHSFQPATSVCLQPKSGLPEALMEYFSFETMCEGWRCDRCQAVEHAQRVTRMWYEPPRVLVVSLKRFCYREDGVAKKLHNPCTIPEDIEMNGNLVVTGEERQDTARRYAYRLSAMVQHYGSIHGGHYTCLAAGTTREGSRTWFHIDDHHVHVVKDVRFVLENNRHAYMLFYERRPDPG